MHKLSDITQRLLFVNVLALVSPSPVRLAIVNVQYPSPPNPSAAYEGAFFTNIAVSIAFAYVVM